MICVYVSHEDGVADPIALQALGFGPAEAVLVGPGARTAAAGVVGATRVHVCEPAGMTDYAPQAVGRALAQLVTALGAQALLATGTVRGNEVLAHAAAILDAPFAAECFEVDLAGTVVRSRWAGNLTESATITGNPLIASLVAHTLAAPETGTPEVVEFSAELTPADLVVTVTERVGDTTTGGTSLADAKVIVSGGRGAGGPEGFAVIDELAAALGAAVGCSRVVTSAGWRPHAEQVGQTGTKVAPDVYLACGISGATQHLAGCKNAKTLIAINTDAQAPIMAAADYVVVADMHAFLPELLAAVQG